MSDVLWLPSDVCFMVSDVCCLVSTVCCLAGKSFSAVFNLVSMMSVRSTSVLCSLLSLASVCCLVGKEGPTWFNWWERSVEGSGGYCSPSSPPLLPSDSSSGCQMSTCPENTCTHHRPHHYGLTGGWVQKFKASYLLCFLHSALVFKARGQCDHHAFPLA